MNPERISKVLAKIGYLLLQVQSTERVVKLVMQVAMPHERDLFTSVTERISSKDIRRPLGPFLSELRKRATLHNEVDELLARFLERRNAFIHNISKIEGWSLKTEDGLAVVDRQLVELLSDSKEVRTLFMGLLHSWKVQTGIPTTTDEDEAFEAVAGKYEGGVLSRNWSTDA